MIEVHPEYYCGIINKIKRNQWPNYFKPSPSPWFPGHGERCIEVPWALSRYRGQKKILEVGFSCADMSLVRAQMDLKELTGCELYGLDIVDIKRVLSRFAILNVEPKKFYNFFQGDVRCTKFQDNIFDLIFIVSTLEHIGFDEFEPDRKANTVFKRSAEYPFDFPRYEDCREDRKALVEMKRILAPQGSILITVPIGSRGIGLLKDSKNLWALYKDYTLEEWAGLVQDSQMMLVEERFFRDDGSNGWIEEDPIKLLKQPVSRIQPTTGIVCAELKKD